MTKTLEFAYETPQEVKVGDDETTFTLVCKNEDLPVDLTTAKLITVKIGNHSGYLRGQLISIDSLAKLPTGQFNFSFDKDTLANFPTGNYCLEVWVTDAQGTSIYPSGNPLNFIVTTNIENSSGATITTITFDDFVAAMNKAASTIAKGDKGDTGPQGVMTNDQVNTLIDNKIKYTSGNLDVTPAFYKAGTTSSTGALNYVRTGNKLHVSGVVSPSADLAIGSATTLFNLPSSIGIIAENVAVVQQSSGWNLYCLSWNPNGAVSVLKHNIAGTATAITTTTQLQVCADILIK